MGPVAVTEAKSLTSEWRKRIASSPEAKQAHDNLEFQKRKVRRMTEELNVAEEWLITAL